jgi:glycosyltransferase involved in cell wall biosynthesis
MNSPGGDLPSICFVGINNLSALAPEFRDRVIGGAELQQTLLAKGLAREGFKVSMVVADLGQPDGEAWYGVRTFKAYRPDEGIPGVRFLHPRWSGVWAALKRANAQIRYCSCAGLLPGQLALFTKSHPGRVVFRIAHDTDCEPERLLIPNWRGKVLYRYGLRHVDLILAQTSAQQARMLRNFGRDSRVVPSMVDLGAKSCEHAQRDIDALWVSNIRRFKRPDLALELALRARQLRLHMIGGSQPHEEGYFESIRAQAARMPNVIFHGALPYDDVNAHIARARVFVNTSDAEGFPNTYLQAWARGTPVVAFFDPDGVIAREGLGRAVHSLAEMHAAVHELLGTPDAWQAASTRCLRYVAARHGSGALDAYVEALSPLAAAAPA